MATTHQPCFPALSIVSNHSSKSGHTPVARPRARILHTSSGRGLRLDAQLLKDLIEDTGWEVEIFALPAWSPKRSRRSELWGKVHQRLLPPWLSALMDRLQLNLQSWNRAKVDLQIHLESPAVQFIRASQCNWLIPNQEWTETQHLRLLSHFDRILCKTRDAHRTFSAYHGNVRYLGFSGPIAMKPPIVPVSRERFGRCLHVAGNSLLKGTQALVDAWRKHPEWPELTIVIDDTGQWDKSTENIVFRKSPDDHSLISLRQRCGIVFAPSEAEGFGHVILEGMAYSSVVVTTDAPPMNELVTADTGVLVPWTTTGRVRLGYWYRVGVSQIEMVVDALLKSSLDDLVNMGERAQVRIQDNHVMFVRRLKAELVDAL